MGTEVIHMYVTRKRFNQTDAEALHSKPYKYPVTIIENSRIREITDKGALVENKNFETHLVECDNVVTCHVRSNNEFYKKLQEAGILSFNVGDSSAPSNLSHAVREGAEFVLNLDESLIINANGAVVNHIPLEIKRLFNQLSNKIRVCLAIKMYS